MGLALLAVIWLITFISTYFFIAKTWWLPAGASASVAGIDHQFAFTYLLMGIVFVLAQCSLGLFVWQYRDRGAMSKADYSHGNLKMEIAWTALTAILFVVFDIEAVFIYPWAMQFKSLGWNGLGSMFAFLAVVIVALVYVVKKGALEWES